MKQYDVIIIGGGPGGYVAAIRLAQLDKNVALVENEHLGGICLNYGCIPTKSLLKSAEIIELIKKSNNFGIDSDIKNIDIEKIVVRSRNIASKLSAGIKSLMHKNKIDVINGFASIGDMNKDNRVVDISTKNEIIQIMAKNIIIATGARARILKGFEPDAKQIWTAKEAMMPTSIPKSIIIVGSGAIGMEFASFYNAIGSDVTIVEAKDRILPLEDSEISIMARKIFEKKNIKIHTNVTLLKATKSNDSVIIDIELEGKSTNLESEILLMAVGIVGNVENINLEKTKIKVTNTHIVTNEFMQTDEPDIYAIGDVAGAPWLAHKASHEGICAAEHICGLKPHIINKLNIPSCTYSLPEIASVGLTEIQAKEQYKEIKVGKFPLAANGKALVDDNEEGLIKTIFDATTGELLGAHLIGQKVTELLPSYLVAKNMECVELDVMNVIFPHPTLSETLHESVLNAYLRSIHI
jgi:dihydrolipoamide dehydrogenase